jgi:hypothetical protein
MKQDGLLDRAVTRRPGASAAERKRRQREREALLFETEDWHLFLDPATLPQKAGCQPDRLRQLVLRELADNALDAGAHVTLELTHDGWLIADDGPGIDIDTVPDLFAVNRPLRSSKLKRLPSRGMVGNGLRVVVGAVAASGGSLTVETRGRRLRLSVDAATGRTQVTSDTAVPPKPGLRVWLNFGPDLPLLRGDAALVAQAIEVARHGSGYAGSSNPHWYSTKDFHILAQRITPPDTTVGRLCAELGLSLADERIARDLDAAEVQAVLDRLYREYAPVDPKALGFIGTTYSDGSSYACHYSTARIRGAEIPFVVEAWADCERSGTRGQGDVSLQLLLNRTPSVSPISPGRGDCSYDHAQPVADHAARRQALQLG